MNRSYLTIFHLNSKAGSTKSNQEKVKPLLEVLKATRYAGAIFIGMSS